MPKASIKFSRRKDRVISLRYPGGREVVSLIEEIEHPVIKKVLASFDFRGGLDLVTDSEITETDLARVVEEA